ncbi:MAG: hypothetical protein ABJN69_12870 [Hellea sp.]
MALSPPFKTQLRALRTVLNERVETVRHSPSGLDTEAFSEFLEQGLDPIVRAAAQTSPERLPVIVDELFTMALSVVSTNHAGPGARQDYVNQLWRDVAPSLTALIAHDPIESLGALTNAMIKVAGDRGIDSDGWLKLIGETAPDADNVAALKSLGVIAAWCSGGVKLRGAALAAADGLPEDLACKAVGAPKRAKWDEVRGRIEADMWWRPDGVGSSGHVVGGFAGFRGSFLEPPLVEAAEEGFWVLSGERCFHLIADGFGAYLEPVDLEAFETTGAQTHPKTTHNPAWAKLFPAQDLSLAQNAHSVAASSPHSYSIHISPLMATA